MSTYTIDASHMGTRRNAKRYAVIPAGSVKPGDEIIFATRLRSDEPPGVLAPPYSRAEQIGPESWVIKTEPKIVDRLGKEYVDRGFNLDSEDALTLGFAPGNHEATHFAGRGLVQRAYLV